MKSMLICVNDHGKRYTCLAFVCPGCIAMSGGSGLHMLAVNTTTKTPAWEWNGDINKPALTPSIRTRGTRGDVCHSYLINGRFEYLVDSTHALSGKEVDMPDLPDWFVKEKE